MSDFQVKLESALDKFGGKTALRTLMDQRGDGSKSGNWKSFPCPFCHKKSGAGLFEGGGGQDLFKCHHSSCPSGTSGAKGSFDAVGYLAYKLGINRKEIIDLVYLGQSEPFQTGPRPSHPWFHDKLSRQFTNHDLKQANEILDRLGYAKRDAQKFRLRPDGQRVFFSIDVIPTLYPDAVDTLELVKRHWVDIGVDIKINTIERALFYTRGDSNDHDAATWPGPGGLDPMLDARDSFAQHPQGSRYAIPWTQWYVSAGKDGQEPPESQKQRMKLFDEARATADLKKRGEIMKKLFDQTAEAFETIGICLAVNSFGIAKTNLQNVPKSYPNAWSWPNPGPALPQQFFFTRT